MGRLFRRSGRGLEAIPEVRDGLLVPPKGTGGVERPSWKAGTSREALPEVQKRPGDPSRGLGRVGILEVWVGSESPPGGRGRAGRPSWKIGPGQEALLDALEGSGVPPGGSGLVGRFYRRSETGW